MITEILDRNGYKILKFLKKDEVILCEKENKRYIVKTGKNINYDKIISLKALLNHINKYEFLYTIVPDIIYSSGENDQLNYYVTEFIEGTELEWSEYANESWGGKNISSEYAGRVYQSILELEKVDVSGFSLGADYKNKYYNISDRLKNFYDMKLISIDTVRQAEKLFEVYKDKYFNSLTVSNLDFYFRNLIFNHDGKMAVVDWEGYEKKT